ncbi:uncharacterized protein BDFB_005702 [Asbolus verrucosus]|uniref:Uncharacterized protein n=1 Tax=Asbolus verrucosus TaxID=1661398 RepID=A0A482VPS0_ASBVE|nr:uncharacterized protein BDFB_005702 [Asbolus verrucosus]
MLLVSFGEISCCIFSLDCPSLIFGGLNNGTIVIWDTKENLTCHKNVGNESTNILMRSPTYTTEIHQGHCCKILCSLDEDGEVIVWSVIFKGSSRGRIVENQGLAHWGAVIITINTRISLKKLYPEIDDFKCTDLALSQFDSSHLYISTSYGIIVHCLATGGRTSVKKFLPETQSQANCLEMCPFSPQYILAGFDNGNINFYSRVIERPLMVLSNKDTIEEKCKIQKIQWSYNRPLLFYTKDISNTIHIWNLKVSDMFPIYSVPFKDNIVCMKLSPVIKSNDDVPEKTYMMIATDKGSVYVHLLDDEHGQQSLQEFEEDKKKFLNYINRYV